jgi:mRNA interferase MazF
MTQGAGQGPPVGPTFPRTFPRRGEIYMVDFNPARGSEQAGIRPAIIVSNDVSNQHSPVVIVAAITTTIPGKDYPQNVRLEAGALPRAGTIYCGQLYTIDKTRLQNHRGDIPSNLMPDLDRALTVSLGLPRPTPPRNGGTRPTTPSR